MYGLWHSCVLLSGASLGVSDAGVAPAPNPPLASMHTEAARGNLDAVQRLVESENPVRRKVRWDPA